MGWSDFRWQDAGPELARLAWQVPVVAQRDELRLGWRQWRTDPKLRRALYRALGWFTVLFGLVVLLGRLSRTHYVEPARDWIMVGLVPIVLVAILVGIHVAAAWLLSTTTIKLKDTRVVVLQLGGPHRLRVRNLTGFALVDEGEWRRLHLRGQADKWESYAMPKSVDTSEVRRWMRERRIPEVDAPR